MNNNYIDDNELLVDRFDNGENSDGGKDPKFRRPKKIFKKRRTAIVFLVILGVLVLGALTGLGIWLFAPEPEYDDSAAFYFSSDILSEDGGEFVAYESIEFNVYNYADALRVSKEPLESFSVEVRADGRNITSKSEINIGETAMAPNIRSGCAVSVKVPEKYNDKLIEVSVISSPIKKELKASFRIEPAWGYEVKDEKGNVAAELVIYANRDVNLMLTWDGEKLIADSTNSYVRTAENGEKSCIISLSAGMSTDVALFKTDIQDLIKNTSKAFSLSETEEEAEKPEETKETQETEEISETEEVA